MPNIHTSINAGKHTDLLEKLIQLKKTSNGARSAANISGTLIKGFIPNIKKIYHQIHKK